MFWRSINFVGSLSSILGLAVSLYVLWREIALQGDVTKLKAEEEEWHDCKNCSRGSKEG